MHRGRARPRFRRPPRARRRRAKPGGWAGRPASRAGCRIGCRVPQGHRRRPQGERRQRRARRRSRCSPPCCGCRGRGVPPRAPFTKSTAPPQVASRKPGGAGGLDQKPCLGPGGDAGGAKPEAGEVERGGAEGQAGVDAAARAAHVRASVAVLGGKAGAAGILVRDEVLVAREEEGRIHPARHGSVGHVVARRGDFRDLPVAERCPRRERPEEVGHGHPPKRRPGVYRQSRRRQSRWHLTGRGAARTM